LDEQTNGHQALQLLHEKSQALTREISQVIIGQDEVVREVVTAIFSGGHALLVGVPGLAKTLLVNTIAQTMGLKYSRIQFTPDLMPSDIVGSEILDENRKFKFIPGPIFGNVILADEINRTPPKTQSALLEAMQERAVTTGGVRHELDPPFFVLATQNPIEQEGTYPLPEAQLDRFMFNIKVDYPSYKDECSVVMNTTMHSNHKVSKVLSSEEIKMFQRAVFSMPTVSNVVQYAVDLAHKTRPGNERATETVNRLVSWGAGPRASQFLVLAAKTHAAMNGKFTPDIEDVKAIAAPVLRHRIVLNYQADAEARSVEDLIAELL
jgi:MoxR-like ATPase